jgi:hypothetical protein
MTTKHPNESIHAYVERRVRLTRIKPSEPRRSFAFARRAVQIIQALHKAGEL